MPKRIGYCLGKDQYTKQCANCSRKIGEEVPEGTKIITPKAMEGGQYSSRCGLYLVPGSTMMISKDTNKDRRKKVSSSVLVDKSNNIVLPSL